MTYITTPRLTVEYSEAICRHNDIVRDMCEAWTVETVTRFKISSANVCRLRELQEKQS